MEEQIREPSPTKKVPTKGIFIDGVWGCNCNPRLSASKFQVKKPGRNRGRWFYTCRKPFHDKKRCDFFIWEEDAKLREATSPSHGKSSFADVSSPSNRRTVRFILPPESSPKKTGRDMMAEDERQIRSIEEYFTVLNTNDRPPTLSKPTKRKLFTVDEGEGEGDDIAYDRTSKGKNAVVDTGRASTTTPRKSIKTRACDSAGQSFRSSSATPPRASPSVKEGTYTPSSTTNAQIGIPSPAITPSPFFSAGAPVTHPNSSASDDLYTEIIDVLTKNCIVLNVPTEQALKGVLNNHCRRVEGITRGRNIARTALKERDTKLAELTTRCEEMQKEKDAFRNLLGMLQEKVDSPK